MDCSHLAGDAVALERDYRLDEMPRVRDLLADTRGSLHANFAFKRFDAGRIGAAVEVEANPILVCQRCLQGFEFPVKSGSEIEFTADASDAPAGSPREAYAMSGGTVSLKDLAEEELLLALPIVAACAAPAACGPARTGADESETRPRADETRRPFAGLQEMLKKTR
ncbi:MAG TPA: YceD family protein [Steroidobacteraceae bacterium]|nr:YceD family protein [Steroidobacteraceae bacterium]